MIRKISLLMYVVLVMGTAALAETNPVQTVDLSGTWGFSPNNGSPTTIQVPGGGWKKQGFTCSEADYSRSITIPNIGQPQVTKLKFGAVNYQADLYVNEIFVAGSIQSNTPAAFDITDRVTPGSSYTIRVHVKGHDAASLLHNGRSVVPNGVSSWCEALPDGIFRSAELLIYPQVFIEDVFVRPYVSSTSLYYDVWLRNDSTSAKSVTLSGTLGSWNGDSWSYPALPSTPYSLPADSVTKVTVGPVSWNLPRTSYWWPNVPYQSGYQTRLHNLNLSISGGGSHQTSVRFGFRECTQGPDGLGNVCYFLNGTRVNFRGDSFQVANYDRINNGGKGNAYDTLAGFLPGPNGWPKAVDNFQRLNFNVIRLHQIPAPPYIMDVCDEKGLMLIDETGIRGAGQEQDYVAGFDNMVNHVKQLLSRDRNHPSVIRLSQSNEPDLAYNESAAFEQALYNAAMQVDGTRPISMDELWNQYPGVDDGSANNFSVYTHYGISHNSFAVYTDEVFARSDQPYGQGEFVWWADNTRQGFCWFGTATQAMRAKGASEIRPYTLLSAWCSVIPGVNTTDIILEQGGNPLYGENNLPDPWNNSQIQRVQAGFNPVLVADSEYWNLNKLSNSNGDWPVNIPKLSPSASVTRTLNIYNDTFSGTAVDVFWELRQGSATGTLLNSGLVNATVGLGTVVTQNITFTTPNAPYGTLLYLVLHTQKNGVEIFRETSQRFVLDSAVSIPLINAGFEQPGTQKIACGFECTPNVPGWKSAACADSGVESGGGTGTAPEGLWAAFIQTVDPAFYQVTGHIISLGDTFDLTVAMREIYNAIDVNIAFYYTSDGGTTLHELYTKNVSLIEDNAWHDYTIQHTVANAAAVGSNLVIYFDDTTGSNGWTGIDDVRLTVSRSSTPPVIVTYDSVITISALLPAALSAVATDVDGDLVTAAFTLLTADPEFPAGAVAYLQNENVTNPYAPSVELVTNTAGTYKVKLAVTDGAANSIEDIAEVLVYDNACAAAQAAPSWAGFNAMDFNTDCDVNLTDLAAFSAQWLNSYDLTDLAAFAAQWLDDRNLTEAETFTANP